MAPSVNRVGQGYDVHRLVPGRRLVLAGRLIDSQRGLAGHSDADVVLHAVIDALLGAAGLDDIGQQFPDTDPAYKDCDSAALLRRTREMIEQLGYAVVNVDTTIIAEWPQLKNHKAAMRENLAQMLDLTIDAVGIKAKTNEGLGEIGAGQAIACHAIVALARNSR